MTIDATKSVTAITGLVSRDVINEQQNTHNASVQTKNSTNISTNVSINQNSIHLLHSTNKDIDVEKIEKIKQSISNGTLVIDTHKIADKLIKQLLEDF
ncbi:MULTISPECIES: flagellar biosynthesis anti-sigma factor FlgM [unclassified Gilliamella]|uniref:flagellar biosynthesis anti-sigma factor FlgM n=1 Tax=unclassified Gilliamella TaxID=2685620 RepID=UPI00080E7EE6|nr:flagellar biosynthesis anti-sigma factor FlgM [Gilliamella apicola]OCG33312.1 flagellar biosynthesis anti-sigma factor FlgM [Gilliamella apicola]OCG48927.1 flagellar biosynthesis anti-sigma factor FlgM [Gilliamella apicola]OCG50457.1 flagellar biosynthesis anti-sigma factor FlgM [Gilliamella apicola]